MRCNVWGWLLGLPVIALIWGLAIQGEKTAVIKDLEQRTSAALAAADLGWARTRFNITEGTIIGAAYSEQDRRKALEVASRVWGVWELDDATDLVAEAPKYIWGAALGNGDLRLTGYVPNTRTHRRILEVSKEQFPQRDIRDDMQPARGGPGEDIWIDGISFGLRQLMQLKKGARVGLNGTSLEISGEAESVTAYRAIKGDFSRRIPSGITLASDGVRPPRVSPYTWRVAYRANQLDLDGHVPTQQMRARIIDVAKEVFPKAAIIDKMTSASGEPADLLGAITTVLRAIAPLENANARLSNLNAIVTGQARKEITAGRVISALKIGMPDSFSLDHKIEFREPTLPTISPFTTTLASDGQTVSLTGYAPDESSRRRLVNVARQYFSDREIVDALTYANGAPVGWLTCADAGLRGLSRLDRGRAELSDDVLRLSGETRSEQIATDLPSEMRAAANRACKDVINIDVKTPPEPMLNWQAVAGSDTIQLSGSVINSKAKAAILKRAASLFPQRTVVDEMRIKPGRSDKWLKVVMLGLEQLALLRTGTLTLDGLKLHLEGVAPDMAVSTQAKSRLERSIVSGYSGSTAINVKSDAMLWSEQEARRKEAAAAQATERKAQQARRAAALKEIQKRAAAAAERARAEALAKRRADEDAQQRKADQEAAKRKSVQARQAELRCKQKLNETVRDGTITFEFASDRLDPASAATLDKLIETYRTCPDARLVIEGHTDSIGSDEANMRLSEQRAEAVLTYFIEKGLPSDRFIARGYGETKPRRDNSSAANRALNRRIEFSLASD